MRAFDAAWSVLKADPRMQAYHVAPFFNMHPDLEEYHDRNPDPDVRNLGTIDPNVLAMLIRRQSGGREGNHPQNKMSRMLRHPTMGFGGPGSYHDAQSPASFLSTPASDHYANIGEGFTGREISREPRPEVPRYMTIPPRDSPQAGIDRAFRAKNNEPMRRIAK